MAAVAVANLVLDHRTVLAHLGKLLPLVQRVKGLVAVLSLAAFLYTKMALLLAVAVAAGYMAQQLLEALSGAAAAAAATL
jgi:hypothetical protein